MPGTTETRPGTLDLPGLDDLVDIRDGVSINGPWIVILYNCDCHSFDDVAETLVKAIECTIDEAYAIAFRVHTEGRAIVFSGSFEECERVASVISTAKLQVETDRA